MGKKKSDEDYKEISRRAQGIILKYLNRTMPGLLGSINWYFRIKVHKSFLELFLEDPVYATNILLELQGGDEEYVRNVLYMIFKLIFGNNYYYIDQAFKALNNGDSKTLKELIREKLSTRQPL